MQILRRHGDRDRDSERHRDRHRKIEREKQRYPEFRVFRRVSVILDCAETKQICRERKRDRNKQIDREKQANNDRETEVQIARQTQLEGLISIYKVETGKGI